MDKFCKFCGTQHTATEYPKQCDHCSHITWINPTPVAVLLQPVMDMATGRVGILTGKREIEPQKGKFGLVGGFIDCADKDVIAAARREFLEEIGFEAPPASLMHLTWSYSDSRNLLLFVQSMAPITLTKVNDYFVPNSECSETRVSWEAEELCFVSHTEAMARYFAHRRPSSVPAEYSNPPPPPEDRHGMMKKGL